jgi:hypothetical protein
VFPVAVLPAALQVAAAVAVHRALLDLRRMVQAVAVAVRVADR